MGPAVPAIIGGIASLGSALIGGHGQSQTNAANALEAQKNRDFQERMRSSQYQTAVDDMRKAGLNPALAYQQGGAGTPSGSTAVHSNTAAGAPQAAGAALQTFQSLRKTAAEIEQITAQTDLTRNQSQVENLRWGLTNLDSLRQHQTFAEAIERTKAESKTALSTAKEAEASATIRELGIPEAQAIAAFYRSLGKAAPWVTGAGAAARTLNNIKSIVLPRR